MDEEEVDADLARLAATMTMENPPSSPPRRWSPQARRWELGIRPWTRILAPAPEFSSFTSLMRGQGAEESGEDGRQDPAPLWDMAAFPRGTVAGSCLHALWEAVGNGTPAEEAARRSLERYGLSQDWVTPLVAMVEHTLDADLDGFCLRGCLPWVTEMEFLLPTPGLSAQELAALAASLGGRTPPLPHDLGQGWITGFLDAVVEHKGRYYVLDWKSHWLGQSPKDYTPEAMARVMEEHGYDLQASLYLAALDRLLAWRLPGTDPLPSLGGAMFLFVRGIHPHFPGHGILKVPATPSTILSMRHKLCSPPQR